MLGDKLRFRFAKTGDLRFLSHLDLSRCIERMLRRAEIPFASSAGFSPKPRMLFALAMPLGAAGLREVFELELLTAQNAPDIQNRLNAQAPHGLVFRDGHVIAKKASAIPRRVVYRLAIPNDRCPDLASQLATILAQDELWVPRLRPRPRELNIRPFLRDLSLNTQHKVTHLTMDFWVSNAGTARADEVLNALSLSDLLDQGAVLERSELELYDEMAEATETPPEQAPTSRPWKPPVVLVGHEDDATRATWGSSPNGPVVE